MTTWNLSRFVLGILGTRSLVVDEMDFVWYGCQSTVCTFSYCMEFQQQLMKGSCCVEK